MDALEIAWGCCLIVTVIALPMGLVRLVAIGSGGFERSRTMRISAWFNVALGVVGLLCLLGLSIALLTR
ncbi:MAG TPA: hypothetical protein VFR99_11205 [Marmoricola sp.]|nr:hypothetical protein [Marmoricola sp.]